MAWGCNRLGGWWDSVWTPINSPTRSPWSLSLTDESSTSTQSVAGCARLTTFTNSSGVTPLIDLDHKQKSVIFVTPGKDKGYLVLFRRFLREHSGDHNNIAEVVCNLSPAFLTVDWFHIAQFFTTAAVDEVRKAEAKERKLPKATSRAVLKTADGGRLTKKQQQALAELETGGFATDIAWQFKEMLRWIRKATSVRAAQWRITHFTRHALQCIALDTKTLAPVLKVLMILEECAHLIPNRWTSNHSNARLEGA
ncbi:hypothetical protein DFAR_1590007 [Desulfarculales bacterium]